MAEKVGSIYWDLDLDDKKFKQGVSSASKEMNILEKQFKSAEQGSMLLLAGLTGATVAAGALATQGIKTAANLETIEQGFVTLLGSAEAARKTMDRIKREAKRTPFEVEGLSRATQLLAAVTKDGDKSVDILLDIGESLAAMGKGQEELDRIIVNLQQIGAVGRASTLDIKQFAFAGIPIFEMLQKETGKSGEALEEFITDGGVTFDLLTKMFDKATSQGGRFFGAFQNQTGTFNQVWANLSDTVNLFLSDLVESSGIFDMAKDFIGELNKALETLSTEIEAAGGLFNWLKDIFKENEQTIYIIAGAIVGALVPAFVALATSIWSTVAPLIPFIAIGAALGFLLAKLVEHFGGLQPLLDKVGAGLEQLWAIVGPLITPALERLQKAIAEELWPALQELWALLEPHLVPALKMMAIVLGGGLVVAIIGFIEALTTGVKLMGWFVDRVKELHFTIMGAVNGIVGAFNFMRDSIAKVMDSVPEAIKAPFRDAFEWIKKQVVFVRDALDKLNPFHRESPSLVDWVSKGTDEITGLYGGMFDKLNNMSARNSVGLTSSARSLSNTSSNIPEGASMAQAPINITLAPQGIIARSRGELRDIIADGIEAVNEELRARGVPQIGGGYIMGQSNV